MPKHQKFTSQERDLLATLLASGVNKSECARRLSRPRKTVMEEIKRNGSWVVNNLGQKVFVYVAISAQAKAQGKKERSAHNKQPLKNDKVFTFVTCHLRRGWSPEQIAGRLKLLHPHDKSWHICHETIYQWVYERSTPDVGNPWYEYLRRKQKKRRQKTGRSVHRSQIPDRVSIHLRPAEIDNRTQFGHWEGDSIEGKGRKSGLHTEAERISRKLKAAKVGSITSNQTYQAQYQMFRKEPPSARRSTTLDNGKENHLHYKLRATLKMDTYFADPYSSWQRGTNEHANWHLRYYFPKGTDFATVKKQELQAVVREINNRPRKILEFKTANEVYYQLLKKARV